MDWSFRWKAATGRRGLRVGDAYVDGGQVYVLEKFIGGMKRRKVKDGSVPYNVNNGIRSCPIVVPETFAVFARFLYAESGEIREHGLTEAERRIKWTGADGLIHRARFMYGN